MWIWNLSRCEGGDPKRIVQAALAAGLSHVIVKIADGTYGFNPDRKNPDTLPVIRELQSAGITVWGWQYVYGDNPGQEAIRETGVTGFVIDAEVEYKEDGKAAAAKVYSFSTLFSGRSFFYTDIRIRKLIHKNHLYPISSL